jgi:uroporphyrinogen decarboxylase
VHRQAGRYLPEFREERKKADFFTICRTPALACEVTLQPIRRFALDAAIIFSDILVVPQALGLEVQMVPGVGPVFPDPLLDPSHLARLTADVDVQKELGYVFDAITLTRHKLEGKVPLIGFAGAPWTLMAYMVQGKGAKSFDQAKKWLYAHTAAAHTLLQRITDVTVDYLIAQAAAGAQLIEVFDSWAGDLTPACFDAFCLPYISQIATRVKAGIAATGGAPVPMTIFAKGAHWALEQLAATDYDCISLDWTMDPAEARRRCGPDVTLQGNLDPCILYGDAATIQKHTQTMIDGFGTQRYIANLGHGMLPSHEPVHLGHYVDEVHEHSKKVNAK